MQVFTPHPEPIATARVMFVDQARYNKQIVECRQILSAIEGRTKAWANHPVVAQYRAHAPYLQYYLQCFVDYKMGDEQRAADHSRLAMECAPDFLTDQFCDQHKRRLYTKSPTKYAHFELFGVSDENWYFVDGRLRKYRGGKLVSY